jgi:DNA uptake protein ComE-like DNA-binding protein
MKRAAATLASVIAGLLLARAWWDESRSAPVPLRRAPASGATRLLYGERLDPNREPAEVLALLPGLGPARAAALVSARPLCSLADVDRVPGIGPATLRQLAPRLALAPSPRGCP